MQFFLTTSKMGKNMGNLRKEIYQNHLPYVKYEKSIKMYSVICVFYTTKYYEDFSAK